MYPESMDPEETGLNSSHLKYLLIPYFKQLWIYWFYLNHPEQCKAEETRLASRCTCVICTQDLFSEAPG